MLSYGYQDLPDLTLFCCDWLCVLWAAVFSSLDDTSDSKSSKPSISSRNIILVLWLRKLLLVLWLRKLFSVRSSRLQLADVPCPHYGMHDRKFVAKALQILWFKFVFRFEIFHSFTLIFTFLTFIYKYYTNDTKSTMSKMKTPQYIHIQCHTCLKLPT